MYYKLSNTANKKEIEEYFGIPLKYPKLYSEEIVIDGLKESNLIIRTKDNPRHLEMAIWGILPERYTGDWQVFQNVKNTLNYNVDVLMNDECFNDSLLERRCLVSVTGFFTSYLINGKILPHYVYLSSKKPFCLAGVYNRLSDGFLTCSVLLSNNSAQLRKIQNLSCEMPIIISRTDSLKWLNEEYSNELLDEILNRNQNFLLDAHPVSTNLHTIPSKAKDLLTPVNYKELNGPN